jgi:hypothetical protein
VLLHLDELDGGQEQKRSETARSNNGDGSIWGSLAVVWQEDWARVARGKLQMEAFSCGNGRQGLNGVLNGARVY